MKGKTTTRCGLLGWLFRRRADLYDVPVEVIGGRVDPPLDDEPVEAVPGLAKRVSRAAPRQPRVERVERLNDLDVLI